MDKKEYRTPVTFESICEDCAEWTRRAEDGQYLYIASLAWDNMFALILNGGELWYGPLCEINAVVKSMLYQQDDPEKYKI